MDYAKWRQGRKKALFALVGFVLVSIVLSFVLAGTTGSTSAKMSLPTPTPIVSSSSSPTPVAENCTPEFTQVTMDRAGSAKVDPEFASKIDKAVQSGDENAYRNTVLMVSGQNGHLLATYAHQMGLHDDPNNWESLVDGNCLSNEGQRLYSQLEGAYKMNGVTFAKGEAPENGLNSGVNADGIYGVDSTRGISGDRTAIEITLPDGSKGWIMFRCGNPVFMGTPNLPTVPTDNPPPPVTPPGETPPPTTPPTTGGKIPTDDPWHQGHAPTGGGPNANPGPGTYIPPTQMEQPGPNPYVPPAPPAPRPPAQGGGGGQVPRPDPAPAPAPQPSAPAPTDPVNECVVIPGVEDC